MIMMMTITAHDERTSYKQQMLSSLDSTSTDILTRFFLSNHSFDTDQSNSIVWDILDCRTNIFNAIENPITQHRRCGPRTYSHTLWKTEYFKVFPYSNVEPGADPGVQTISPQITF